MNNTGLLVIQIPNRFFPIELHSGIPFFFYLPKKIRSLITMRSNLSWMEAVDIPNIKALVSTIVRTESKAKITIRKISYEPSVAIPEISTLYAFISRIGLFTVIPMGYLVFVTKSPRTALEVS
jgi:hypothetical protein